MVVIIVLTLGIVSLALGLSTIEYGMSFDVNNVEIEVHASREMNAMLCPSDYQLGRYHHVEARNEIIRMLDDAGRTNRLFQIFQSSGEERVTFNPTANNNIQAFQSNHNHHYIQIGFVEIQFAIYGNGTPTNPFRLVNAANYPTADRVHQIFIPLSNISNSFGEHEWFISTSAPGSQGQTLNRRFITWGNFHALSELVNINNTEWFRNISR